MWTDISQFDIPEYLKTAACGPGHTEKYTDIGEVCVVNSMFGKAKVRVIHPRKKRSLYWPLAVLAITGVAVAVWLEQEMQKPHEPMRIIVKPVSSEDTLQASPETSQVTQATVSKAAGPKVPNKPQASPGLATKETAEEKQVTVQPGSTMIGETSRPLPVAKPLIPANSQTAPLASDGTRTGSQAVVPQTAKPPSANQPLAQSVEAKTVEPGSQKDKPATVPADEPLPEINIKPVLPASIGKVPDQGGAQP